MFTKLLHIGMDNDQPAYLQKKIRLSNILSLFITALSFPYILFTYYYFPSLLAYPILAFLGGPVSIFLNLFQATNLSRIVTAINIAVMLVLYHGYLIQTGEPLITGFYLIQLGFIVLPVLIFDLREKVLLVSTTAVSLVLFLGMPLVETWLDQPFDNSVFRDGPLAYFTYIASAVLILTSLVTLIGDNLRAELRSEGLIVDTERKNEELKNSENTLKDYIAKLSESQVQEQKRNWAAEGFARFSDLLRKNNDNINQLSSSLISSVTTYVKANQGALFILNSEAAEPFLELTACYAYNKKKYNEKRIELGQGLIGQACLEKEVIYMTSVPKDYVHITSGLGEALPRSILIVPMIMDNEVLGVLEFASFSKFEKYEIEFIQKVGESIASTLKNVQTAERTKRLLSESQLATEELKSQEEELRQNIEELQATQENQSRLQKELHAKEAKLLETMRELETAKSTIESMKKEHVHLPRIMNDVKIAHQNVANGEIMTIQIRG